MDTKQRKQTFLVLIDFSKRSMKALKYAISLTKIIDGKIVLLYVGKPKEVVVLKSESTGQEVKDLDKNKAEVQLRSIMEMIESEGLEAEFINTVGHRNTKINEYIKLFSPALVVLGKSDRLGKIAEHLIYQNNDNLLLVDSDVEFNTETQISIACNETLLPDVKTDLLFWLSLNTLSPLFIFVNKKKSKEDKISFPRSWKDILTLDHTIGYKKKQHLSVVKSFKNHIVDNHIELVCIDRKQKKDSLLSRLFYNQNTTKEIIHNTHIPILVMAKSM